VSGLNRCPRKRGRISEAMYGFHGLVAPKYLIDAIRCPQRRMMR